jgi:AcrR family transcriptional regulator
MGEEIDQSKRGRGEAAGLCVDDVVDAACELLDRDGWDKFSIRRVAVSLGVTPAALYQHVPSKEQLLDLVADRYLDELTVPGSGGDWILALESLLHDLRRLVLRRPLVAHVMLHHQVEGQGSYRIANGVLGMLRDAGFDNSTAVELFTATCTYTLGFALHERTRRAAPLSADDRAQRLSTELAGELPALAAAAGEYAQWWSEAHFSSAVSRVVRSYHP